MFYHYYFNLFIFIVNDNGDVLLRNNPIEDNSRNGGEYFFKMLFSLYDLSIVVIAIASLILFA